MVTDSHDVSDEHAYLHHHFDDMDQQRDCTTLGMWAFLATELMMFGGLFFSYTLYRWMFHGEFVEGSRHLNVTLGTINTFVLLVSSLTMAMAVHAAAERKKNKMIGFMGVTWILGFAFLAIKAVEWTADFHEGLVPAVNWSYFTLAEHAGETQALLAHHVLPAHMMMYFVIYFCMTGLHAIHMIIGLLVVGAAIVLGRRGQFTNGNDQPVEIIGLYWHLIDIIWVFLFPLLYLIGGFHPLGGR